MMRRRALCAAAALAVVLPERLAAQDESGGIVGRVSVEEGVPARGARVEARGPGLPLQRYAATDASGYFEMQGLPVGRYDLRLFLVGYRPVALDSIPVRLGRTTSIGEVRLTAQAAELGEIEVTAERPLIDPASAAAVTNLPAEQFEDLPTDRNFRSIVSLAPQANLSRLPNDEVNIAGGTGPENAYFLDGVNITDPFAGSTSSNLPYNFIRELQVKAGGYEAEFGRATGGIVNVVTHTGGNEFGGQVFAFYTGSGLSASPRFALPGAEEAEFTEYDFGGSLGGPILRDRLWFFAAYNPSFRRQQVTLPDLRPPDETRTQHLFATKLTWQPGPRTDVTFTVHGDPGSRRHLVLEFVPQTVANEEAIVEVGSQGGVVLSSLARHRLSGGLELEGGASWVVDRDHSRAPTELGATEPFFLDYTTGTASGGRGITREMRTERRALRASLSAPLGRHGLKVGAEYEDNRFDEWSDQSAEPGSPGGTLVRYDETTWGWGRGRTDVTLQNRVPTVYAQDAWRVSDRLTLNLGLRWEGQYLTTASGDAAQSFTDQWQPRAGAVYLLDREGSHRLFGAYGRFYEQLPLSASLSYYNDEATRFFELGYDHDPRLDPSGGDTNFVFSPVSQARRDLRGQSFDEFSLGWEGTVGPGLRAGVRGVVRRLRWALEDAMNPETGEFELGNPGRDDLAFLPRARRTYRALVLTLEKPAGGRFGFLASYVLSRSRGNYEGLYDFQQQIAFPNTTVVFDLPEQLANSTGLLPNDRPHVLKFSGSYRVTGALVVGTALSWASGMPRNELGASSWGDPWFVFLRPRGSAGRTESIVDANVRMAYALPSWGRSVTPTLFLDVFHLGNARTVLRRDDARYVALDDSGNQAILNPGYDRPLAFHPPMSARLGMTLDFGELR